jgi:hypothetical protein
VYYCGTALKGNSRSKLDPQVVLGIVSVRAHSHLCPHTHTHTHTRRTHTHPRTRTRMLNGTPTQGLLRTFIHPLYNPFFIPRRQRYTHRCAHPPVMDRWPL